MWQKVLTLSPEYNYPVMLKRLTADPIHYINTETSEVKIPVSDGDKKEGILLRFYDSADGVELEISGRYVSEQNALQTAANIFLWDRPLENIRQHFLSTDLKPLFEEFAGTPLVGEFETYGSLMKTIIHQQLNMSFAYTLSSRFVHTFGERVGDVWFYPKPEYTAELAPEKLQELQFSRRKAEYVIDTSKQIVEKRLDLADLKEKTNEEIIKTLTAIRGIGPWTAECFLLFGLGRENLLPAGDIGIQNGLKKLWNRDAKPSVEEVREMGQQWSPYASYAALYIWLSTEF
ncbi:DNA-3-methyladenine glycosylase family protein [Salibacterium aidingense]|uniref:DNA-3-methyladenine glycosylase family protein n=1 Tax=Salibacterium aidingense TaxID=384933 RepID=UPI0003FACC51|nr:DNA-3-methyladenine glycosylase [Salibacterium aidingense]